MSLAPGTRLGPYEIVTAIGAGGMGEVYRGRDTRLDRDVAVKVLPPGSVGDAPSEARFDREARAIAALNHPNICALYDVGRHNGRSFLVMELLEGETLHARLARAPFDVPTLVDHAIALADALDNAHARGLLHRDLKPANIFLTKRGPAKILDFGLTKAIDSPLDLTQAANGLVTDAGIAVGTVGYMSPEQLRGEAVDARSDLFALGTVLYEMATGRRAFAGATQAVVSAAILGASPAPPRTIRHDLPPRLEETILKTLERDRDERCQTAAELRADLKRVKRAIQEEAVRAAHSVIPTTDAASGMTLPPMSSSTSTVIAPATSSAPAAPRSSDAQLVVGLVKRHPLAVTAAIGIVAASLAAAVWLRTGQTAPPPSTPSLPVMDIQALTRSGNAGLGALSPDGKFVAYLRLENGEASVWVRQLATTGDVQIVPMVPGRNYFGIVITPDGTYVDFVASEPGIRRTDLWRVPFLGGTPRKIVSDVWSGTGWSPDGKQMAFIRAKPGEGDESVVIADADGVTERVIARRTGNLRYMNNYLSSLSVASPSWSDDGRSLLVIGRNRAPERTGPRDELVVIDIATGKETRTVPVSGLLDADWLGESHALVDASIGGKAPALIRIDLATGAMLPVMQDAQTIYWGVSLTQDRRSAVTTRVDRRSGLWMGTGAADSMTQIVPESGASVGTVSLDGLGGVVYAIEGGEGGVYAIPAGARSPTVVVTHGGSPQVTADGRTIVFTRQPNDGLYRTNTDGSGVTRLADGQALSPQITPDGKTVYFIARRTGEVSLWEVPLAGGQLREVVRRFVATGSVRISPDGKQILFGTGVVDGKSATMVCDLPDCTNPRAALRRGRWTPDGRGLAYAEKGNIWVQSLDGGQPRQLTKFTDQEITDFAWSPDGKRLAVSRRTDLADVVLIKGVK